jgi:hypothetical protein
MTGTIQGKIIYLSPPLGILRCGSIDKLGRAPRLTRQQNREFHILCLSLYRDLSYIKDVQHLKDRTSYVDRYCLLSLDISVVQHLKEPASYTDRNRLPYRGGNRCLLVNPLEHLSLNQILQCIWLLMSDRQNSAILGYPRLFIKENSMVEFALAKSLRGDLVCQFEKQVWKVREGRRRPLLAQESTQRISNHVLTFI